MVNWSLASSLPESFRKAPPGSYRWSARTRLFLFCCESSYSSVSIERAGAERNCPLQPLKNRACPGLMAGAWQGFNLQALQTQPLCWTLLRILCSNSHDHVRSQHHRNHTYHTAQRRGLQGLEQRAFPEEAFQCCCDLLRLLGRAGPQ